LTLTGDTTRGRLLFRDRCASCHRLGGEGHAVGPDLVSVRASGPELLLGNILDPNREVAPRYVQYTVETDDSETISGLIATESSINITLRAANGVETVVSRSHVRRFRGSNESMMPEGLETGWKPQDLADLIRFVLTAE
jgi:putative heme-binding domain-containing protein